MIARVPASDVVAKTAVYGSVFLVALATRPRHFRFFGAAALLGQRWKSRAMDVEFSTTDDGVLAAVIELAKHNKRTLGFLPDQVFIDAAAENRLLIAISEKKICGYLLFRTARGRASITHLCVDKGLRRGGCARMLFERLKECVRHLDAITLRCKRKLPAYQMWSSLGFYPCNERPGRSKAGDLLTDFRFDFGKRNLFSDASVDDPRLVVAVDSNVAIALVEKRRTAESLTADWVTASVRFVVAREYLNDLDRTEDDLLRKRRFADATNIDELAPDNALVEKQRTLLRMLFPEHLSKQDRSDLTHIAVAAAGNAMAFLTLDKEVLKKADEIYRLTGLSVMRPAELVTQIDRLEQEQAYRPVRIAGCQNILDRRVEDLSSISYDAFRNPREKKTQFEQTICGLLERPRTVEVRQLELDGVPTLLYALERNSIQVRISLMRCSQPALTSTVVRRTLWEQLRLARRDGIQRVEILPSAATNAVLDAAQALGFSLSPPHPVKTLVKAIVSASDIHLLDTKYPALAAHRTDHSPDLSVANDATSFEHHFWPLKIWDASLPTYIVAIETRFATELFDTHSANQALFNDDRLALNVEGAYYRGGSARIPKAPGRILWYVKGESGAGHIVGCSRTVEFRREPPKPLFSRFQRLGVFEFPDVLAVAKGDLSREVNGVRFDDTELFDRRISWNKFHEVLARYDLQPTLQSPAKIPPAAFHELYVLGFPSSSVR